jgi:hypothetical protein
MTTLPKTALVERIKKLGQHCSAAITNRVFTLTQGNDNRSEEQREMSALHHVFDRLADE